MANGHPSLGQGTQGPAVTDLQQRLIKLGFYKGPVNGKYTPDTAMAVVAIQKQEKLQPVNGGMYEDCWDALERLERAAQKQAAPPQPPPPARPAPPPPAEPSKTATPPKTSTPAAGPRVSTPPMKPVAAPGAGAVTSAAVYVAPPDGAVYQNLRFEPRADSQERAGGTDLCADAPAHEGKELTFTIEVWREDGWVVVGQAKATVKSGVARTSLPADLPIKIGDKLRFRIVSDGPSLPPPPPGKPAPPPPQPPKQTHPALFQGATGDAVSDLQRRLHALGLYKGNATGRYDAATAMAVVALQQHAMLTPVNGGMYQACWVALEKMEADGATAGQPQQPPPPQAAPKQDHPFLYQSATGPAVRDVQQRLARLGLYKGPISGTYSPDTAGAVVKLQQQKKLSPVNGGMYAACWDALEQLESGQSNG